MPPKINAVNRNSGHTSAHATPVRVVPMLRNRAPTVAKRLAAKLQIPLEKIIEAVLSGRPMPSFSFDLRAAGVKGSDISVSVTVTK